MRKTQSSARSRDVEIGAHRLGGMLAVPADAKGLVIFAHGSGSSRLSPRNTRVAREFNARGLATLLFDLLTELEAADRRNVFDIPLLGTRVAEAVGWARKDRETARLAVGLFGASTGAGMQAIAFDYIGYRQMDQIPQVWTEEGTIGDPGTIYHPDTAWDPTPWGGRHRIYIANESDQTIYAGYLTAE